MKFLGYRRSDGMVGIRNHVLILPTVGCAAETCRIAAGLVDGAVSLINQNGCGEVEGNRKLTQTVLAGLAANPNVYGTILVGLGCELNLPDEMAAIIQSKTNPYTAPSMLFLPTLQQTGNFHNPWHAHSPSRRSLPCRRSPLASLSGKWPMRYSWRAPGFLRRGWYNRNSRTSSLNWMARCAT